MGNWFEQRGRRRARGAVPLLDLDMWANVTDGVGGLDDAPSRSAAACGCRWQPQALLNELARSG